MWKAYLLIKAVTRDIRVNKENNISNHLLWCKVGEMWTDYDFGTVEDIKEYDWRKSE